MIVETNQTVRFDTIRRLHHTVINVRLCWCTREYIDSYQAWNGNCRNWSGSGPVNELRSRYLLHARAGELQPGVVNVTPYKKLSAAIFPISEGICPVN